MALSSLCVYGDSDSDEETTQGQNIVLSMKKSSNIVQEKGKSKKVKVSLPKEPDSEVNELLVSQVPLQHYKSSLTAILPRPRGKRTSSQATTTSHQVTDDKKKSFEVKSKVPKALSNDDSSDEEDTKSFLFLDDDNDNKPSLHVTPSYPPIKHPRLHEEEYLSDRKSTLIQPTISTTEPLETPPSNINDTLSETGNTDSDGKLILDEDTVRRLAGKRRGNKKNAEDISLQQLVDFTETEIKDSVKAYQKYSTEQSANSGNVAEDLAYSTLQKRKHQITWLAHQAKSREIELKNFWAQSAAARKQSQMKYGF